MYGKFSPALQRLKLWITGVPEIAATPPEIPTETLLFWAATAGEEGHIQAILTYRSVNVGFADKFGKTALHWLARKGHHECVDVLLPYVDAVATGKDGETALHEAVLRNHPRVVECLLDSKLFQGQIDKPDNQGRTALHWAAICGRDECLEILLEREADLQKPCYGEINALHLAIDRQLETTKWILLRYWVKKGDPKVIQRLLDENKIRADDRDAKKRTMLSYAAEFGSLAMAKILVNAKYNGIEIPGKASDESATPIMYAIAFDHADIVQLLIEYHANLETRTSFYNLTPLLLAAGDGRDKIVNLLLDMKVDIEASGLAEKYTPLAIAAQKGHEAVVRSLLAHNANIEARGPRDGRTPLMWAALCAQEGVVKILLEYNANIEAQDGQGLTPLWHAASQPRSGVVKLLLESGADPEGGSDLPMRVALQNSCVRNAELLLAGGANVIGIEGFSRFYEDGPRVLEMLVNAEDMELETLNSNNETALFTAIKYGSREKVALLVKRGAALEAKDQFGNTPLICAVDRGRKDVARDLISAGAHVNARNDYGLTALMSAVCEKNAPMVKLLLDLNADPEIEDKRGLTALTSAERLENEEIINLLRGVEDN